MIHDCKAEPVKPTQCNAGWNIIRPLRQERGKPESKRAQ